MTDADSLQQIAHSRAPFSVWLGTVLLFLLFGAIVLTSIGPTTRKDRYEESRAQKRVDNLKTLREADAKALRGYAWVDKAKGTAHIPIERAMQLTMAELSQKKPAAAYPIATASPAAPAAPSAAPKNGSSPVATPVAPAGNQSNSAPQASPATPSSKPTVSPTGTPNQKAPGTPLPVAGQTPTPTP